MLVFTDNIRWLVIWSIALGAGLCLLYDVIRVFRNAFSVSTSISRLREGRFFIPKLIFLSLTDLFFCITVAFSFLILAYYTNGGVFRGLILICAALGFVFVRMTLSRPFVFLCSWAVSVIKKLAIFLFSVLLKITKPIFWLYHLTLGRIICIIKDRVKKKRERREEERMRLAGKEENVTVKEDQTKDRRKERIVIGRRAEKP